MDHDSEDFVKKLMENLELTDPDNPEPVFWASNLSPLPGRDWCHWFLEVHGKDQARYVMPTALIRMMIFRVALDKAIEMMWQEENEVTLELIQTMPQLWSLLAELERTASPKKPKKRGLWSRFKRWLHME